jgi:phosphate transport system permease protein
MSATTTDAPAAASSRPVQQPGDRIFANLARGAGILILVVLAGVAVFLISEALPAFLAPASALPGGKGLVAYIAPLVFGTVLSAVIALVVATPLAVGVALFITHYAPRRVAQPLAYLVDLLAAVPSIVYGLWGAATLGPASVGISTFLNEWFGWLPFFSGPVSATGRTMLTAGLVLAVMILPIITAVSREVFRQTPKLHEEAALALGATRWEMIRIAVLPYGRSGIIGGAMLGLGRALGETMAVTFVIGNMNQLNSPSLFEAANSITSALANEFAEAGEGLHQASLIYLGLVLFFITFVVLSLSKVLLARLRRNEGGRT